MLVQVTGPPSCCFPAPTCGCKDPWAVWFGTDQPPCPPHGSFPVNAHPGAPLHDRIHWAVSTNPVPQRSHQWAAALTQCVSDEMKRKHPVKRFLWGQYSARAWQTSSQIPWVRGRRHPSPSGATTAASRVYHPHSCLVSSEQVLQPSRALHRMVPPCPKTPKVFTSLALLQRDPSAAGEQRRFALPTHAKCTYINKSVLFLSLFYILLYVAFLEQLMYDQRHLKRVYPAHSHADMSTGLLFSCKISKMKIMKTYC